MKTLLLAGALALSAGFPSAASAEMYQYVAYTGFVKAVDARDAADAMQTAPDIDLHSGVAIMDGRTPPIPMGMYIPVSGIPAH
jgi:hypothetical protein